MNERNVADLAGAVVESGYANIVLQRLTQQTQDVLGADHACIFVGDRDDPGRAIAAAATGVASDMVGSRFRPSHHAGDGYGAAFDAARMTGPVRVSIPLGKGGCGAMAAGGHWERPIGEAQTAAVRSLASAAGAALSRTEARERLLPCVRERLGALSQGIAEHDGYTADHSAVVVDLCLGVGERLGLEAADLLELELAAWFHDLGKIYVPGAVLRKPGPLDEEEYRLLKRHPVWGAKLLASVPGLEAVAAIVRFHHERWDGAGYPDRVAGEHIPLAARILSVCDAFHAITSDRPYRPAIGAGPAMHELKAGAGTQFDAAVVQALEDIGGAAPARPREVVLV